MRYLLIILVLGVFSCEKKEIAPIEDEKEVKKDSTKKCGCPDDYMLINQQKLK